MADSEAEKAFFEAQALNADPAEYGVAQETPDTSNADDYDPMQAGQDQSYPQEGDASAVASSALDPLHEHPQNFPQAQKADVALPSDEGSTPSDVPSQTSHGQNEAKETGEENGVEAEYEPPAALSHVQDMASVSADIPQRSVSQNMNETVSSFDVSQQQTQTVSDKITPHDVPNSSFVPASSNAGISAQSDSASKTAHNEPQPSTPLPSVEPTKSPTPAIPTTAAAASRARLPHDRVGILEDRIEADPRGDLEAWLELISEHRSRNKVDSARQVYERFFKVFPAAVSPFQFSSLGFLKVSNSLPTGRTMGCLREYGVREQRAVPPGADI